MNAGNGKDASLRNESTNGPSGSTFPVKEAQREARILAAQACRDTPRLSLDPEDLQQRLILEAVKAFPKHQPSLGSPMTYLSGVMRRQVLAEKRRAAALRKRDAEIRAELEQRSPHDRSSYDELEQAAVIDLKRAAISAVPQKRRFAAAMVLDGLGDQAIGERLGAHRGTVNRMRRMFVRIWRERFPDLARDISGSARRYRNGGESPGGAP